VERSVGSGLRTTKNIDVIGEMLCIQQRQPTRHKLLQMLWLNYSKASG